MNAQPDWTPLEVVGDFMRERSLEIIATFPWTAAGANVPNEAGPRGRG